jgi:hypothetical protein
VGDIELARDPAYVITLSGLGLLYQAMGDYVKALSLLERARDLDKKLRSTPTTG